MKKAKTTATKPEVLFEKRVASPIGYLRLVASDKGLVAILWDKERPGRVRLADRKPGDGQPIITQTEKQLEEYFKGKRTEFTVPLDMRGTKFQKSVWKQLLAIPFGKTRTYGEIAVKLGLPNASRAVGAANGRNPVAIIAPCHRVVGSTGALTGFAGGLDAKAHLLSLEGQDLGTGRLKPSKTSKQAKSARSAAV
jgi:methylated-DNA-[protein]-cysteine S-methyltransferase